MVKIESADEAKKIALDFLAKMGLVLWSHEVQSIKKSENKWIVQIKSIPFLESPQTVYLEIDANTGKIVSYERQ